MNPAASERAPSGWSIERTLEVWRNLQERFAADPDLDFDEAVIARAFETAGTATPEELVSRLIDAAVWAARREDEAEELRKAFQVRRDRYALRKDLLRRTIQDLMGMMGWRRHVGLLGSVRLQQGPDGVQVVEESQLPNDCFTVTRTVSKTAIREYLNAGNDLGGAAVLTNGGEILVLTRV